MKLHVILLQFVALILPLGGQAQTLPAHVQDPDPVSIAINHYRNLEYEAAKQQLRGWIDTHPTDLRASNYLATATLYNEMFERGVLESSVYGEGGDIFKASKVAVTPSFQQELFSILDKSQQLAEERLKNNPNDKDALYWAGVSHGTRATYHFALRKEYMPALHEASAAYKYHSDLLRADPNYVDAYLVVGMNNYVVGSLPWYVKVLASLTGRHGNREEGIRQVQRVTEKGSFAREDGQVMLASPRFFISQDKPTNTSSITTPHSTGTPRLEHCQELADTSTLRSWPLRICTYACSNREQHAPTISGLPTPCPAQKRAKPPAVLSESSTGTRNYLRGQEDKRVRARGPRAVFLTFN
jgi:hypothetical protein